MRIECCRISASISLLEKNIHTLATGVANKKYKIADIIENVLFFSLTARPDVVFFLSIYGKENPLEK